MQQVNNAGSTQADHDTVTLVTSSKPSLTWISPAEADVFHITADALMPEIIFEFEASFVGEYTWSWTIEWEAKASGLRERERKDGALRVFKDSDTFVSREKSWRLDLNGKILGGKLFVEVVIGDEKLSRSISFKGQNPSPTQVTEYVETLEGLTGFDGLLAQETRTRHFIELDGEPIVSFDQGYGIAQMTHPAPSYEQAWNWKANILAGSSLFKDKVRIAKSYLGQGGRSYTQDQLRRETFSRWNGGAYHQWDSQMGHWVRRKSILCDTATGNIGWAMNKPQNAGKTESQLRERDKATYNRGTRGQSGEHAWSYNGVCYADHVSDQ